MGRSAAAVFPKLAPELDGLLLCPAGGAPGQARFGPLLKLPFGASLKTRKAHGEHFLSTKPCRGGILVQVVHSQPPEQVIRQHLPQSPGGNEQPP